MKTRDETFSPILPPQVRKVYFPEMGIFGDIFNEQRFENASDALEYEKILADRQWTVGGVQFILVDDVLVSRHKGIRNVAKINGYYRFRYDYSGEWILTPLDLNAILKEKEEDLADLQNDIQAIRQHPLYTQTCLTNPLYVPPNQERSNPLA